MVEDKLIARIEDVVLDAFGEELEAGVVMLEIPNKKEQGDYSSNIAMRLTRVLKKNPREIATVIVAGLEGLDIIKKVEIAGPGFINFYIKADVMSGVINKVLDENETYGSSVLETPKRTLVEYVSANPTGQLHIGHARGAAWGDSLTRIMQFAGYDVLREYYVNDLGNQITMLSHSLYARYREELGLEFEMPEDGYYGDDIKKIAKDVVSEIGDSYVDADEEQWIPYFKELGIKFELDRIKHDLSGFRVSFDSWVSEKALYDEGRVEAVLSDLKEAQVTYEKDGALWFKSTDFGDDKDRVLIKSDGSYTYLVPDIANHMYKLERGYDNLLNLWGGDHHGYIVRMKSALEALGHKDVLDVDIIQMVRLIDEGVEVKMSKRTGNAIGLIELVDDIGVDAARYFFVSRHLNTPLDFDLGLARKKSNDNPVFYAQYAHARICSILRQAPAMEKQESYSLLTHEKEIELMKYINEFSNVVNDAAKTRSVQKIPNYIQQLSAHFHSFYGNVKVIDMEQPDLTNERLHLLLATKITLNNALNLIGVEAPETM
ncbi:arginine--tRNA ligase [Erysipelothrix urinaevulpis]|uniref:arginine--tRNA ligase n=1 Tax=Erysipelothrix urinaevulpis TaxID=2683717 RepID=UPI0013589AE9|nr:arginine--tRNA ligase [Erysipelothrix urinaevulpis]